MWVNVELPFSMDGDRCRRILHEKSSRWDDSRTFLYSIIPIGRLDGRLGNVIVDTNLEIIRKTGKLNVG